MSQRWYNNIVHYNEGFPFSWTEVTANYKVVYAKIYWQHFNYSDLFTDRNLVLSSKRLIRKTGIQLLTKITVGGFGFSCKSSLFTHIISSRQLCYIFLADIPCGTKFCFVIMLFKRGVWGAFSRSSPFC